MTQTRYNDKESRANDCKTARIFAKVKNACARGQRERSGERVTTEVTGSRT